MPSKRELFVVVISFERRSLLSMALPLWFLWHTERRSIIKKQEEGNNALAETSVAKEKNINDQEEEHFLL